VIGGRKEEGSCRNGFLEEGKDSGSLSRAVKGDICLECWRRRGKKERGKSSNSWISWVREVIGKKIKGFNVAFDPTLS